MMRGTRPWRLAGTMAMRGPQASRMMAAMQTMATKQVCSTGAYCSCVTPDSICLSQAELSRSRHTGCLFPLRNGDTAACMRACTSLSSLVVKDFSQLPTLPQTLGSRRRMWISSRWRMRCSLRRLMR